MLFRTRWVSLAAVLLLGAVSADLSAQGRSQEQRGGRGHKDKGRESAASAQAVFREGDRAAFQNYFATHYMTARPLPPGIAKNLARGKPLPPGIAKRALPQEAYRIAPPMVDGLSYAIVGNSVVATRAGIVIDILSGVFK